EPNEQLRLISNAFLRFNLFAYSLCFYVIGFWVLGLITFVVARPLITRGALGAVVGRFIVYLVMVLALSLGLLVWLRFDSMAPLLPRYVVLTELKELILRIIVLGALVALGLSLVITRAIRKQPDVGFRRWIIVPLVVCVCYIGFANLALSPRGGQTGSLPRRVVILGIDAGTWNVALPFLEQGYLPAFEAIVQEGTYGYLDTYGSQFTPPVWTSIATGKVRSKHGVYHFGNLSSDWQAAPVWSIASSQGRKVGVVNWVCTWPPFEVNGVFISKIISDEPERIYLAKDFSAYEPLAESLLATVDLLVPTNASERIHYASQEARLLRRIHKNVVSNIDPDFAAYYYYSTDLVQHFFWKDMEPEVFIGGDWQDTEIEPEYADAILEAWLQADSLLAELVDAYGDSACYIVISDHGARPVKRRMGRLNVDRLLHEIGLLEYRGTAIDSVRSICYVASGWSPYYRIDLKINPSLYIQHGTVDIDRYHEIQDEIRRLLSGLKTREGGEALFARLSLRSHPGSSG
ncbi:MAG TPA: hypothetical protein ENI46_01275, partial [Firmicutes bacterium]|nr:hypothetical protein [Bacillota bacterium]